MEALFIYSMKVVICSGAMLGYYYISLKDKTFHHYNRFYLLSVILISLLLPLIRIEYFTIEVSNKIYLLIDKVQNFNTTKGTHDNHIYSTIIFSALGLVSFYFLGKFLYGIFKIQQLKNQFQKESFDGINFYHTNLTEAPFSYFKNLFWKNTIILNSDLGKQILKHEMVHIEQKHTFDKIFIEIITSVFWFNPFFHIIKKEISLIHEYLADKKAVKQSDTKAFAQMLLASHFSGTQLPATSPFLSSNLKKRLKMLQKPQTKFGYARRIFALPVLFSVAFAYMVNAKNKEIKETNIAIAEAVAEIKKDTIRPEKTKEVVVPRIYKKSDDEKKIADLSKKIQEKSKVLKELKPESQEFQKNVDELSSLSEEIGKIANSDKFKKSVSGFAIPFDGEAMAFNFDPEDMKKMNEYFKSDEWKDKMMMLKDMKVDHLDIEGLDFPIPPTPPNSPNAPKVKVYKFKDLDWKDIRDKKWSPEEIAKISERTKGIMETAKQRADFEKKRAELDKKRAKLNEKRAKLEGERAKLEAERRVLEGNNRRIYMYSDNINYTVPKTPNTMSFHADVMKKDREGNVTMNGVRNFKYDNMGDTKIYIDGKEATKKELDALSPNTISKISINKTTSDGKTSGEMRIETKK